LIGSPGSGETTLARRLQTILPPMNFGDAIETTKIHSMAGLLSEKDGLIVPRPGKVSLEHNGLQFLD
jgi:magnesium chelatase family protein